jgi:hypothetical protein
MSAPVVFIATLIALLLPLIWLTSPGHVRALLMTIIINKRFDDVHHEIDIEPGFPGPQPCAARMTQSGRTAPHVRGNGQEPRYSAANDP